MRIGTTRRIVLGISATLAVVAVIAGLSVLAQVPERKNAFKIEVGLMAEECAWERGRMTLVDGLRCVRGKIDGRLKELEEEK